MGWPVERRLSRQNLHDFVQIELAEIAGLTAVGQPAVHMRPF
jgi:hypothetical protein